MIGGRTPATSAAATKRLGGRASWRRVDTYDEVDVAEFFEGVERVDGLLTT